MITRLVVGGSSLGQQLVETLAERRGSTQVLATDRRLIEQLRERDIPVESGDPTDPETLGSIGMVDLVVVAADDFERNRELARAAREAFPAAYIVAYAGETAPSDPHPPLEEYADVVIDPIPIVAEHTINRVTERSRRVRQLRSVLGEIESLAIVTHDNPDPDAIASGVALKRLAEAAGCSVQVCYFGNITHQQNLAFVNLLDLELRNLDSAGALSEFDGVALVDHSSPGVNDQLPADTPIDIVIDHHPPKASIDAQFVDLRSDVGATSTILVEYAQRSGITLEAELATALLFGIYVDTQSFRRQVSVADFQAAGVLAASADFEVLKRIESPSLTSQTLDTVARAIRNRHVEGTFLMSCVGQIAERDALAQAADRLLSLEQIATVLVYGFREGTIYVSARSRGTDLDLGETLRDAFGQIGSAGGHVDMAGGQIDLGVLDAVDEQTNSLRAVVEEVIEARFFDAVEARVVPSTPTDLTRETITERYLEPDAAPEDSAVLDGILEETDLGPLADEYPPDAAASHPTSTERTEPAEDPTAESDDDTDTGPREGTVPAEDSDGENDSPPADTSDT